MDKSSPVLRSMNDLEKRSGEPRDKMVGIERVLEKYEDKRSSRTASLVERARPEEKAILAKTVSISGEGGGFGEAAEASSKVFVPRMMVSPMISLVWCEESSTYARSSISIRSKCGFSAEGRRRRWTSCSWRGSGTFQHTSDPEGNTKTSPGPSKHSLVDSFWLTGLGV